MRAIVAALVLLTACASEDPAPTCPEPTPASEAEATSMVESICGQEMVRCEMRQSIELASASSATVFVSPVRCAEDLELCGFAVWHELGHIAVGTNHRLADCYAADRATPAQTERAICYFSETAIVGGADAAHGSGESRAERIIGCRR